MTYSEKRERKASSMFRIRFVVRNRTPAIEHPAIDSANVESGQDQRERTLPHQSDTRVGEGRRKQERCVEYRVSLGLQGKRSPVYQPIRSATSTCYAEDTVNSLHRSKGLLPKFERYRGYLASVSREYQPKHL